MYTLGFAFKPWLKPNPIAGGDEIRNYVKSAARDHAIDEHISYLKTLISASYSTPKRHWTLTVQDAETDKTVTLTCGFLHMCSGYYSYESPFMPNFKGVGDFQGRLFHAQHWPKDLDYANKKVVIIGSGATAITLLPSMVRADARHLWCLVGID